MTGLGVLGEPLLSKDEIFFLRDNSETQINASDVMKYFGTDRKTFSISKFRDFEFPRYSQYIFEHKLADWKSYSGSPIFFVDEQGQLHLMGIGIGGYIDGNVGLLVNHPFLEKHVNVGKSEL